MHTRRPWWLISLLTLLGGTLVAVAVWNLERAQDGVSIETLRIGETPATAFSPARPAPGDERPPVIVIAHGFAGSQQLMRSFALSLAKSGYRTVTFDFLGHGRNAEPLTGDITTDSGATQALLAQLEAVVAEVRAGQGDEAAFGTLGHSMATDILVRFSQQPPIPTATVAVSLYSQEVTPQAPRNFLVIVGDLEGGLLKDQALDAVAQVAGERRIEVSQTIGRFDAGSARRAVFAPGVEHISVLYSGEAMTESVRWFDQAFGAAGPAAGEERVPEVVTRGPWIGLLFAGLVVLAWPLTALLPRVVDQPGGAGLSWAQLWKPLTAAALLTPLALTPFPTDILPLLVGDYLGLHFALFGLITYVGTGLVRTHHPDPDAPVHWPALLLATVLVTGYAVAVFGLAIDRYVTAFVPIFERLPVLLAILAGTLAFFVIVEWTTRGTQRPRSDRQRLGANAARDGARARVIPRVSPYSGALALFLLSLALAVILNFAELFFLIIILPAILAFLIVFGLISHWSYRQTGSPIVGAIANAALFAWALASVFPLLG